MLRTVEPRRERRGDGGRVAHPSGQAAPAPAEATTDGQRVEEDLSPLEARIGRRFRDRRLLALALVHRSYLNEANLGASDSNERLEFLGDAVLGFVITRDLFRRFPEASEGQLTALRADLVRWETLAEVALRLDLGAALRMGRGEQRSGGRARPLNLARAFEALTGAVAEDGGLAVAERFIRRVMRPELAAASPIVGASDAKSRLQQLCQAQTGVTPAYRVVAVEGPDHDRRYRVEVVLGDEVLGSGSGSNKRIAERAAATAALTHFTDDAV